MSGEKRNGVLGWKKKAGVFILTIAVAARGTISHMQGNDYALLFLFNYIIHFLADIGILVYI